MLIVALGWIYVVTIAAIAEALSPQGTVLGAIFTFVLYGPLPLAVVLYLLGTSARKQALRKAEAATATSAIPAAAAAANPGASASVDEPDGRGHPPAGATAAVAPKREEP
jgi:hypothetical protein